MTDAEKLIEQRINGGVSEASVTLAPTSDAVNTSANAAALLAEAGKQLLSTKKHLKGTKLVQEVRKVESLVDNAYSAALKLQDKVADLL